MYVLTRSVGLYTSLMTRNVPPLTTFHASPLLFTTHRLSRRFLRQFLLTKAPRQYLRNIRLAALFDTYLPTYLFSLLVIRSGNVYISIHEVERLANVTALCVHIFVRLVAKNGQCKYILDAA